MIKKLGRHYEHVYSRFCPLQKMKNGQARGIRQFSTPNYINEHPLIHNSLVHHRDQAASINIIVV